MSRRRQCPRCGYTTRRVSCCGIRLEDGWRMNEQRWKTLRHLAFTRKGLDGETFRWNLHAVGAQKAMALNELQYQELVARLVALPDWPGYQPEWVQGPHQIGF